MQTAWEWVKKGVEMAAPWASALWALIVKYWGYVAAGFAVLFFLQSVSLGRQVGDLGGKLKACEDGQAKAVSQARADCKASVVIKWLDKDKPCPDVTVDTSSNGEAAKTCPPCPTCPKVPRYQFYLTAGSIGLDPTVGGALGVDDWQVGASRSLDGKIQASLGWRFGKF